MYWSKEQTTRPEREMDELSRANVCSGQFSCQCNGQNVKCTSYLGQMCVVVSLVVSVVISDEVVSIVFNALGLVVSVMVSLVLSVVISVTMICLVWR